MAEPRVQACCAKIFENAFFLNQEYPAIPYFVRTWFKIAVLARMSLRPRLDTERSQAAPVHFPQLLCFDCNAVFPSLTGKHQRSARILLPPVSITELVVIAIETRRPMVSHAKTLITVAASAIPIAVGKLV